MQERTPNPSGTYFEVSGDRRSNNDSGSLFWMVLASQ